MIDTGLIKTKYCRPGVGHHLIQRKQILDQLNEAGHYKLTLVTAPAGYGKSTAVLSWVNHIPLPTAWFSIDEGDNDPVRFWRYLVAAMNHVFRNEHVDFIDLPINSETVDSGILAGLLIDKLYGVPADALIVLDDFHLIHDPEVRKSFTYFLNNMPSNFSVVLISRKELVSDFENFYIQNQVLVINHQNLSFSPDEISRFFILKGYHLSADELSWIEMKTEGWAAGLVVASLAVDKDRSLFYPDTNLPVLNHHIERFLKDQIFQKWPDEVRLFLSQTSILDRFSAPLCQAVTGLPDCQGILKRLLDSNNFIIPLEQDKVWFRYHHLFADFLRERLAEQDPSGEQLLYQKAGQWYQDNDYAQEAMDAYLKGGAYRKALDLFWIIYYPMLKIGEHTLLLKWMNQIPQACHQDDVVFCVTHAWLSAMDNQMDEAGIWANQSVVTYTKIESGLTDIPVKNYMQALTCLAQADLAIRNLDAGRAAKWYATACGLQLKTCIMVGDLNLNQPSMLKTFYGYYGRLNKIDETYTAVCGALNRVVGDSAAYLIIMQIEAQYERNQLDACYETLVKGFENIIKLSTPGSVVPAFIILAKIKRAAGNMTGAFTAIEEGRKRLNNGSKAHWSYLFDLFVASLYLGMNDVPEAEKWMDLGRVSVFDELSHAREYEHIIFSRYLIQANRTADAILLLNRLNTYARRENRLASQIEISCLLALAYDRNGDAAHALETLDQALSLGAEDGYARAYIDEAEPMRQLLKQYLKRKNPTKSCNMNHYAASLLNSFNDPEKSSAEPAAVNDAETLVMEKRVLQLLLTNRSNAEIASEFGISVRTVKYHNSNIFSKMGVKNRMEALLKARKSGPLS